MYIQYYYIIVLSGHLLPPLCMLAVSVFSIAFQSGLTGTGQSFLKKTKTQEEAKPLTDVGMSRDSLDDGEF